MKEIHEYFMKSRYYKVVRIQKRSNWLLHHSRQKSSITPVTMQVEEEKNRNEIKEHPFI